MLNLRVIEHSVSQANCHGRMETPERQPTVLRVWPLQLTFAIRFTAASKIPNVPIHADALREKPGDAAAQIHHRQRPVHFRRSETPLGSGVHEAAPANE